MSSQHVLDADTPRLFAEASAFGRTRLRGGAPLPWDEAAELPAFHRRLQELLEPAVLTVPLADLYATWWDTAPGDLSAAPGRDRPGAALKAMLAAPAPVAALEGHLRAIGDRRPVALELPAPGAWAAWAAQRAGHAPGEPAQVAARAAAYVAGFLRSLGDCPIGHVLVGDADGVDPAELEPLVKVAEHYRWRLGVHGDPGPAHVGVTSVTDGLWRDGGSPAGTPPFHLRVPGDAEPDLVLDRLAVLREGAPR